MRRVVVTAAILVVLAWGQVAQAQSYSFWNFDYPGADDTHPTGISDRGVVVGIWSISSEGNRGFILDLDGFFTSFEVPFSSSPTTNATGINNKRMVVGFYYDASSVAHGFTRDSDGNFASFDYPGASATFAHGISDKGHIAGAYEDSSGVLHGFVRDPEGALSTVDVPTALSTVANGVTSRGEVVGWWREPGGETRGFLRQTNGNFVTIAPFSGTSVRGTNDRRDLVLDTNGPGGAFVLLRRGTLVSVAHPGGSTIATGINNKKLVVGQFQDIAGVHGFIASPAK